MADEVQERSNEELDLLAETSDTARNSPDRPMSDKDIAPPKEAAAKDTGEFEFTHNGKQIKGTRDQIINWAQMGYDRPQVAQKWNQEKRQWEAEKGKYKVYEEIDKYAQQNKEWWDYIQKGWQSRGQPPPQQQPGQPPQQYTPDPRFQTLEQKLSQFEPLLQKLVEDRDTRAQKEEDTKLDREIQTIRESHSDLDWESLDENGKSLEVRVLEHAQGTGIQSFRAAFRDLLHEELVTKAESLGKLAVSRGIQANTKLGVLGQSPTSRSMRPEPKRNIRTTSYNELEQEALDELRSGKK